MAARRPCSLRATVALLGLVAFASSVGFSGAVEIVSGAVSQGVIEGLAPHVNAKDQHRQRERLLQESSTWQPWELRSDLISNFPVTGTLDWAKFHLYIKVIAFQHAESLRRILESLNNAEYLGEKVSLEVLVDGNVANQDDWDTLPREERIAAVQRRDAVISVLNGFVWRHGPRKLHARVISVGRQAQWAEAWWPESVNHFALILEDNVEVSPYFYAYIKDLIKNYYYKQANFNPNVFGISLQRQTDSLALGGQKMGDLSEPYLYPLADASGQVMFPIPWKQFRFWYDRNRYGTVKDPSIGNTLQQELFARKGNRAWTPWHARWAYDNHMYNFLAPFPYNLTLLRRTSAVPGSTLVGSGHLKLAGDAPEKVARVLKDGSSDLPHWWAQRPSMYKLIHLNWCNQPTPTWRTPVRSMETLQALLPGFNAEKELIIVPVQGTNTSYELVRNWLCFADRLGHHNVMFLLVRFPLRAKSGVPEGDQSKCLVKAEEWNNQTEIIAQDLAARGHLVFVSQAEADDELAPEDCSKKGIKTRERTLTSLFTIRHGKVVAKILQLGVNVTIFTLGALWRQEPMPCLAELAGDSPMVLWAAKCGEGPLCPSKMQVSSFILRVIGNPKGTEGFKKMIMTWKGQKTSEFIGQSIYVLHYVAKQTNFTINSIKGDDAITPPTCMSSTVFSKRRRSFATLLVNSDATRLKRQGLWHLDAFGSCASVVCT